MQHLRLFHPNGLRDAFLHACVLGGRVSECALVSVCTCVLWCACVSVCLCVLVSVNVSSHSSSTCVEECELTFHDLCVRVRLCETERERERERVRDCVC